MSFICITPICWSSTRLFTRIAFNEEGPLRVRPDVHRRQFRAGNNPTPTIETAAIRRPSPGRRSAWSRWGKHGRNSAAARAAKQVVASAFWPTSVLPQLAEQNAKIKTLTVEIPSWNRCWRKILISFPPSCRCCWGRKAQSPGVKISPPSA